MMKNSKQKIQFEFVLDYLYACNPNVKPMFGCHGVYVGNKIVLILRNKKNNTQDNGVWMATTLEHHKSLKKEFPNMRSISVLGPSVTGWQLLPMQTDDFESSVIKLCDYILKGDARIGKIPVPKKTKKIKNELSKRGNKPVK